MERIFKLFFKKKKKQKVNRTLAFMAVRFLKFWRKHSNSNSIFYRFFSFKNHLKALKKKFFCLQKIKKNLKT